MTLTKKKPFCKAFFALILATALCLGSLTTAFAAGDPVATDKATIKKVFQMPEGTATPAADFKFKFEKVSLNDVEADKDILPTLSDMVTDYGPTGNSIVTTDGGVKTITCETPDFLAGITFPHAGWYTYRLTEDNTTYVIADPNLEKMEYSAASYLVTIYVENDGGSPKVKYVSAKIETKDSSHGDTTAVGDKVNPTPGSSTLVFTNTYTKFPGGGTPDNGALTVSKTVAGSMGDRTKYFPFTLTTEAAATQPAGTKYKAYLVETSSGTVKTPVAGNQVILVSGEDYFEVTAGTEFKINLKDNESIVLVDIPVGAGYEASEGATANYEPSIAIMNDGISGGISGIGVGNSATTGGLVLGLSKNSAAFTNTFDPSITPTGISLNDLPFILMILLAVGALVLYVVIRTRKRANDANR